MSLIDNDYQTALLFKQFVGVAAARLDDEFSVEKFRSVPNIFSNDVMIEEIPTSAPFKISGSNGLDASGSWLDSSCNYANNSIEESTYSGPGPNNGKTFAEIYPDTHLKFYKRLSLVPCEQNSNGRVWGSFTDYSGATMYANKQSVLKHAIPFKYDDIDATYSPVVRYNRIQGGNGAGTSTPNFQETAINSFPLYWVMDAGTGFLQFYQTQTNLEGVGVKDIKVASVQDKDWAPQISLYVYNGKKGITNLDVSGQVQVGDISGLDAVTKDIERMVLPDGSANPLIDLCGNDTLRAQYEYIRKNLFVGYPTHPIITANTVDHTQDPSHNSIYYELDISGNVYTSGNLDVSNNIDVSGNINVSSNIYVQNNVDISNILTVDGNTNIGGDLDVDGIIESSQGTRFVDYRKFSSDISGSIMGSGNSQWFCIAKIDPGPAGEFANGLFILDDDTSGLRQTIVFRAGSSYSRGNFIDVLSNHYFGQRVTGIKIDVSGNDYYQGANLYIQRGYTTNPTRIFVRVYQNKRKGTPSDGSNVGYWQLTSTPIPNLLETKVTVSLNFQPSGLDGASKVTSLDTLIDAELKVNGKTTLTNVVATDISATNISTTGNVIVGGDLSVQGYTTIQNGQFVDISGMNLILRDQLKIKDTNILVKTDIPEIYQPSGAPNNVDYYEIAFVDQQLNPPGTQNLVDCVTAYFTFTNNLGGGSITDSKQSIHFIAGVYYSLSEPRSFIKVLSNNYNMSDSHVAELVIAEESVTKQVYLMLGFDNQHTTLMENCEIRMYKNSTGDQGFSGGSYSGGGWIMGNSALGASTNSLLDLSQKSVYPAAPFSINSLTSIIKIDSSLSPNAYSNLFENFLSPVDISSNARVGGNLLVDGELTVNGRTTLNDHLRARDISCNYLHVDVSSNENGGIIINNEGSGGPEIKFKRTDTSYLGATRYNKIYTDDPTNDLHIDFGTGSGSHTMYLDGNTNSATVVVAQNLNTGDTVVKALVQNGLATTITATNSGRGKLSLNNGFTSGTGVGGGIDIQCSGTPTPQHDWYIGGSTTGTVGGAIRLKGLTETSGSFPTFASGEVRINAQEAGSGYQDIDFAINTLDISNAFLVDAALNEIIFDVSATIPIIIGPTTISGETIINGNTTINGDTSTNGNFVNTGVAILNDLSFSSLTLNVAELPSNTTIPKRTHQTTGSSPFRNLTVDGYSEYAITTQNLSTINTQEDWVTLARVGFQDMTNQSQRADGLFEITCNNSGCHQTIHVQASHHYKKGGALDITKNITYGLSSNRHIKAIRMAYAAIYDGGILQMQISQNTALTSYTLSKITIKLYQNNNYFGWTSDLSQNSAPFPDNTPIGYSQAGYGGTGNLLYNGSTYSNFTLFFPSATGINLTEHITAAGNPGQSVIQYTSDMILNKVYMKGDLDMSGNEILNATLGNQILSYVKVEDGGNTLFEVESSNNTAILGVPLELERNNISHFTGMQQYSMAIANNIGSGQSVNTAYHRDCIVWRPQITSATTTTRVLCNEHIVPIYNRQPAGSSTSGGFGSGTTDNNYEKYTGSTTRTAYFGAFPNAANANSSSSAPVNSKMNFLREAWITGIYLNTPFIDSGTFSTSSGSGGLFGYGTNTYVDVEIGAPSGSYGYKRVFRLGNPNTGDQDIYYFPSNVWNSSISTNGVQVRLDAEDWIYIPQGTNMSLVCRFKAVVSSSGTLWVRNNYNGTNFNYGQVEGYFTYVTSPKLVA